MKQPFGPIALPESSATATDRIAATWYSGSSFTVDVNLTDGQTHEVALYLVDWDTTGRSERVDVLGASTGAVLSSQTVSSFNGGKYLVWNLTGHVQIKFTNLTGANAVLSGIFFDGQNTNPPPVSGGKKPLPRISNLTKEEQLQREEDNVKQCLRYASDHLSG
jgi:hypothetical protein